MADGGCRSPRLHVLDGVLRRSILRIPKTNLTTGVDEARGEQLRPQIQSEAGLRVLDYLHKLKEVSPPDILDMDWDRRTTSFLSGQTALAYCWTVRAARFENDVSSAVKRKVGYLPQPRGPGGASNNPIGGFLLCIPSNLSRGPDRGRLRGDRLDDFARSDEGQCAEWLSSSAALQRVRRPRGGRDFADRQRSGQAREAELAQGLAPAARAPNIYRSRRFLAKRFIGRFVARSRIGRRSAMRKGKPTRSCARRGITSGPLRSEGRLRAPGRSGMFISAIFPRAQSPALCNFEGRARWTKRSVSGPRGGSKRSRRRA